MLTWWPLCLVVRTNRNVFRCVENLINKLGHWKATTMQAIYHLYAAKKILLFLVFHPLSVSLILLQIKSRLYRHRLNPELIRKECWNEFKAQLHGPQNQWPACEKYAVNIVNELRGTAEPTSTFINKSRIYKQMECTFRNYCGISHMME